MLEEDFTTTVPDYIERSISAPPLSDYATFEDFLPTGTRNNPRRPKSVKSAHFETSPSESSRHAAFLEGLSASLDILDDTNLGSIKSLVIDSKPKAPLDLIQADFPLTPSALYSHNKFESAETKSTSHQPDETDELDDVLTGIDQSTLAMQDLLNPEDEAVQSPIPGTSVTINPFPSQTQGHVPQIQLPNQNLQNYAMYHQQLQPVPVNSSLYTYSPGTFPSNGNVSGPPLNLSLLPQNFAGDASTAKPLSTPPTSYVPQQHGYGVASDVPGSFPVGVPVAEAGGIQNPNGYYMGNPQMMMQSPMYMDYYRMGIAGAFPQMAYPQGEMAYPQTTVDGMTYLPYPQQAIPGYWPQAQAPTQQQQMMYYGQQTHDFNGMPQISPQMMVGMMGMSAGGIMTPHGFMPSNAALQMGYQQMGNGLMPNPTNGVYMHPTNRNANVGGIPPLKQDSENRRNSSSLSNGRNTSLNTTSNRTMTNQGQQTPSTTIRDSLVEDFRNTYGKTKQWEIKDLVGHVVSFCQDQHGSRFIQQRLEVANDIDKQLIFNEIIPNASSLMTDVFGNYVIQKLFEFGNPEQCETLASLLTGQAVTLALQMYGCRVIQKALEYVQISRLITLINEFDGQQILRCVHDQNGNHVIQKCIEIICRVAKDTSSNTSSTSGSPSMDMKEYLSSRILFIIQSFHGRVKELSIHPYGCRVIQRILEYCNQEHKTLILEELRLNYHDLIQDQYGNYVIQHVMQHGYEHDKLLLLTEVQSHLLEYSQHKFASNVVEKCIQYADKIHRDEMIWTIINVTFDLNNPVDIHTGQCVLENMVRDPYANYVVQKVIDVSNEAQRSAIIRYVRENIVQLRRYTYGKHIIVRLEKVSGEKF